MDMTQADEIDELRRKVRDGIVTIGERMANRERLIAENLLRDSKGGFDSCEQ